jgi:hypothetical protein
VFLAAISAIMFAQFSTAAEYEPFLLITVKMEMTNQNGQSKTENEVCHTVAELPWIPLSERDWTMPPQGFSASSEPTAAQWQGREVKGEKTIWRRSGQGYANHSCAEVCIVRSDDIPTPRFGISLPRQADLPVPPGCLKLDVTPLKAGTPGVHDIDIESTFSLSGKYGESIQFQVGKKQLQAHTFKYVLQAGKGTSETTATVSSEIPGNVCSIAHDAKGGRRTGKFTMSIVDVSEAPVPANLETFEDNGFAFSPPDSYKKAAEHGADEIVRYTNTDGHHIAISVIDLGPRGLTGYREAMSNKATSDGSISLSSGRSEHLAGEESVSVSNLKTKDGYVVAEHRGKGYRVFISGKYAMKPADIGQILYGWRWVK